MPSGGLGDMGSLPPPSTAAASKPFGGGGAGRAAKPKGMQLGKAKKANDFLDSLAKARPPLSELLQSQVFAYDRKNANEVYYIMHSISNINTNTITTSSISIITITTIVIVIAITAAMIKATTETRLCMNRWNHVEFEIGCFAFLLVPTRSHCFRSSLAASYTIPRSAGFIRAARTKVASGDRSRAWCCRVMACSAHRLPSKLLCPSVPNQVQREKQDSHQAVSSAGARR